MRRAALGVLRASLGLAVCLFATACPSDGAVVTLTDANAVVKVDPASDAGIESWTVDATEHLEKQWFWYRVGSTGPESSVDTLTLDASVTSDTDADGNDETLFLRYLGTGFKIEMTFVLTGGTAGSGTADLTESLSVVNTSTTESLGFHFFEYCDFDLANTTLDASVSITDGRTATQKDVGATISETVDVPKPSHHEVGEYSDTLDKLNDANPTTLSDSPGPLTNKNLTWAFQWDVQISPEGTFLASKDKHIVPDPATLLLLGAGTLTVIQGSKRRRTR